MQSVIKNWSFISAFQPTVVFVQQRVVRRLRLHAKVPSLFYDVHGVQPTCTAITHSTTRTLVKPVILSSVQLHVKSRRCAEPSTKVSLCTACEPGAVLALSKHTAFCSQPFFLSPPAQEKGLARGQDLAVCFGERAENNLFTGLLETPNYLVAMAT